MILFIRIDGLERILGAVLGGGRRVQNIAVFVDQEEVVVVTRGLQRIGPLENVGLEIAFLRDLVLDDASAEVVRHIRGSVQSDGPPRNVVALPDPCGAVVQIAVVASGREEIAAVGDRCVHPF